MCILAHEWLYLMLKLVMCGVQGAPGLSEITGEIVLTYGHKHLFSDESDVVSVIRSAEFLPLNSVKHPASLQSASLWLKEMAFPGTVGDRQGRAQHFKFIYLKSIVCTHTHSPPGGGFTPPNACNGWSWATGGSHGTQHSTGVSHLSHHPL